MIHIYGNEPSAKALAKSLKCRCSLQIPSGASIVVNWGRDDFPKGDHDFRVLNERLVLDKLEQLERFKKVAIPTPKFTKLEEGQILRTRKHRGGKDIKFLKDHYLMDWIEKAREYRVHIFKVETIRIARKIPAVEHPIWNNLNAHFKYEITVFPKGLKTLAVKAVKALGYDFGAVDIIIDREGRLYVLEVNSAPGLDNPNTLKVYANSIRQYYLGE